MSSHRTSDCQRAALNARVAFLINSRHEPENDSFVAYLDIDDETVRAKPFEFE